MQKLVTVNEASKILNISTQGVHYRIKKNQLKSTKKNGRVFVYIDIDEKKQDDNITNNDNVAIVKSKDEQISLLKNMINDIKEQYKNEINRLEKIHFKTIKVFKSEIELLKGAFVELKKIYQIENKNNKTNISYMSLKEFIKIFQNKGFTPNEIKSKIIDRIKQKDSRFLFDEDKKDIIIVKTDFSDIF